MTIAFRRMIEIAIMITSTITIAKQAGLLGAPFRRSACTVALRATDFRSVVIERNRPASSTAQAEV